MIREIAAKDIMIYYAVSTARGQNKTLVYYYVEAIGPLSLEPVFILVFGGAAP